jgi:hypothetical protein
MTCRRSRFRNSPVLPNNIKMANDPKKFKEGDVVTWQNGAITFKEKIFKMKDGRLAVKGVTGPIPLTAIHLPLKKVKPGNINEAMYGHSVANILAELASLKYKFTKGSPHGNNPYSSTKEIAIYAPGKLKIDFKKVADRFKSKGYQYTKDSHSHYFKMSPSAHFRIDTKPQTTFMDGKIWFGTITLPKKAKDMTLPYYD